MEFLAKMDSWDYIALFMVLMSLWLVADGVSRLKRANPELVDEKKLRLRAWGGLVVGLAYLACKQAM